MSNLTTTPLSVFADSAQLRHYPKGQIVLYKGDAPVQVYIIESGAVKIYEIDGESNEKILHIIGPGAIFPAVLLFSNSDHNTTYYATLTDSSFYAVPLEEFEEKLEQNTELTLYCMRWFAGEVREILTRMASLEKSDTRQKLLVTLQLLAKYHANAPTAHDWARVTFPVSHQLLADMVGVTRESTTIVMKDLQKAKAVRSPRLSQLEINLPVIEKLLA